MNCKVHGVVKCVICLVLTFLLLCGVLWHYYVPDRGNIDFFLSLVRIDHSNVSCGVKEFCSDLRFFSSDIQFVSNSKPASLLSTHFS